MVTKKPVRGMPTGGKPRPRTFVFSEHSATSSKGIKDDRTLKRSAKAELVRPAWNGTVPTTVRILPCWNPDDPSSFEPTRTSAKTYAISDFMRCLPVAKYIGRDARYTFLLYDPRQEQDGYDPESNPYNVLFRAVKNAVKAGEAILGDRDVISAKWAPLIAQDSQNKAFNAPTSLYFVQTLVFQHRDHVLVKNGVPPRGARPNDLPQVLQIPKTAGDELMDLLEQTKDGFGGDTDNFSEYYTHGNLTDLAAGAFITLYNPDKHDVSIQLGQEGDEEESSDAYSQQVEGGFTTWKLIAHPEFRFAQGPKRKKLISDITAYEATIRKRLLWWDDILYFPSHQEICVMLARAFRSFPDVLRFGWSDYREFFSDEVKGILAARTQGVGAEVPEEDDDEDYSEDELPLTKRSNKDINSKSKKSAALSGAMPSVMEDEDDSDDDIEETEGDEDGNSTNTTKNSRSTDSNDDEDAAEAIASVDDDAETDSDAEDYDETAEAEYFESGGEEDSEEDVEEKDEEEDKVAAAAAAAKARSAKRRRVAEEAAPAKKKKQTAKR